MAKSKVRGPTVASPAERIANLTFQRDDTGNQTHYAQQVGRHDGWSDDLCAPVEGPDVPQELPTSLTTLITGAARVSQVHFVIPDSATQMVTIRVTDGSGTPRPIVDGKYGPGPWTFNFDRPRLLTAVKWSASITGVFGYVTAYQ